MTGKETTGLKRTLGTWEVMVSGIALVVAASTLVTDFSGYATLGYAFAFALAAGFLINLLLGLSAADLSVSYPRAGALYDYARAIFKGNTGRFLGAFLGLTFFGMFAFCASGETAAGAIGFQALLGTDIDVRYYIVLLGVLGVLPNIFGIRTTAWVSAALLIFMLGIRWYFGIAGFIGLGRTGPWFAENLNTGIGITDWFGTGGILTAGLALAFWSFVGIEFACSLAEEVEEPRRALPRGIVYGLIGILATSLIMGLGTMGTAPYYVWQNAIAGDLGNGGESPQLAVGYLMFGQAGQLLMALASVAATLGTITVAYAAVPRVLYSIARDGLFFGPLSRPLARLHPRYGTPVTATLVTFLVFLIPAVCSSAVIQWLYSAAYAWIILYVAFHALALANRILHPRREKAFSGRWFIPMTIGGMLATFIGLYYAFAGSHWEYGSRALIVLLTAAGAAAFSTHLKSRETTTKATEIRRGSGTIFLPEAT